MSRSRRAHGRSFRHRFGAALGVALLTLLAVGLSPVGAAPGESDDPITNPDLDASCGIDILVILDESGSIDSANAADEVQDSFRALLQGLKNTGSRVGVIEFDTTARLPLPGAARTTYTTVTDASIATVFEPYIRDDYDPNGSTHWEDAFRAARYFLPRPDPNIPHLVMFITDGDPNRIVRNDRVTYSPGNPTLAQNEYELKIPLASDETTSTDENPAKDRAVSNANALKAQGSHILTVAVGAGLSSSSSLNRIIDVSGPDLFPGSGPFDIEVDDVYRESDFDALEDAMRDAAFVLCSPSVNVRKVVDHNPDPAVDDLQPAQGWSMTATVDPTPADWVLPSTATGETATGVTGADGFVTFQWASDTLGSSTIAVDEVVQPGFFNDPSETTCTYRTPDTPTDQPLPGFSATDGGFTGTVPFQSIVTCEMVNRITPEPDVELQKFTNGADADDAPGPGLPIGSTVEWSYGVENTGNVPLTDIEVEDSEGVTVTCPDADLLPGERTVCTGTGTAVAGQYENLGTVAATGAGPAGPETVTDDDPSHYFGVAPGIDIEKATNGEDADTLPGPFIPVGDDVVWTYVVTNTGNAELTGVTVTDDILGPITCPVEIEPLSIGESVTCTAPTGTAVAGAYENLGAVTATSPTGPVQDADGSHYFGTDPSIDVEKSTNGVDADAAPGPEVAVGETVAWTYVVTNTGNVPLFWSVSDDQVSGLACPRLLILAPGRSLVCRAVGVAVEGLYENEATAVGTLPDLDIEVSDTDLSHYFGIRGAIDIEKSTNGSDADQAPGPFVVPGSTVDWTYVVTNTGNTDLTDVEVVDLNGVAVICPPEIDPLSIGETQTCTGQGLAQVDQYTNLSQVTATTGLGLVVRDEDPSNYFGSSPGIVLEKSTNGVDADEAPGPFIPVGEAVDWAYFVTNTGNATLSNVAVTDDQGLTVTCPATTLGAGASMTCTASGTATLGQYRNIGSVSATGPAGQPATDDDPSHYFGFVSQIDIEKATNGEDADTAPGAYVPVGAAVTWTYTLTNPGNVPIRHVTVIDDQGVGPVFAGGDTDADDELDPGETWTYEAPGTATAGQYTNLATVDGFDVLEQPVTDSDPSNYFGFVADIDIEKTPDEATVARGSSHEFTITVTNTGDAPLTDVTVTDPVTPDCDQVIGDLAINETATYTCTLEAVTEPIVNVASVVGTDPAGGTVDDTDEAAVGPIAPATIGDFVWDDVDRDGVQDAGERGIPNARLVVTGPTEVAAEVVVTTDSAGLYLVTVEAGEYVIALDTTSVTGTPTTAVTMTVALEGGDERLDVDFGVALTGAVAPDTATDPVTALAEAIGGIAREPFGPASIATWVALMIVATVGYLAIDARRRRRAAAAVSVDPPSET